MSDDNRTPDGPITAHDTIEMVAKLTIITTILGRAIEALVRREPAKAHEQNSKAIVELEQLIDLLTSRAASYGEEIDK
jgi:hypothetical protein